MNRSSRRARRWRIGSALALLPVGAVVTAAGGGVAAAATLQDATAYQMNPAHTGVSYDPEGPAWTLKWSKTETGAVGAPIIAGGQVFVLVNSSPPNIVAYNASTGAVDWTVAVGTSDVGITYQSGRLFEQSGGSNAIMSAYDATTGNLDWSATIPGQYAFSSAPTAANGVVYTGGAGSGGTLYAFDQGSGNLVWSQGVMNGDNSSPAADANGVYASYACDLSYRFNPTTGANAWTYENGCEGGGGQTAVLADGYLFLRDQILDATTGKTFRSFTSGPVPAVDSQYAYAEDQGTLRAETVSGGKVLWSNAGDGGYQTAPIVVNGVVYEGSSTGHLYALSAITGQQLANINVGTAIGPSGTWPDSFWGLSEGDGLLAVPAGDTLSVYGQSGPVPSAPTGATATASSGQATVGWTVPSGNGSAITDFNVTPLANGVPQTPLVVPAGAVGSATDPTQGASDQLTVPGLSNGVTYTFTVAADSAGGQGPASAPSNAVTPASVPASPTNVSAVAGQQAAQVSWTVGPNEGSPITSFTIKTYQGSTLVASQSVPAGAVGSSVDPTPGAADTYQVQGLTGGVAVAFTITATNALGPGPESAQSAAVTPTTAPTVPYAPTNVSATAIGGGGSAVVSWTVPQDNGAAITSFVITPQSTTATSAIVVPAGAAGSNLSPVAAASDSYTVTGLAAGSYTFNVAATNSAGTGPASTASNSVTVQSPARLSFSPSSAYFGAVTLGDISSPTTVTVTNAGGSTDTITSIDLGGADPYDFPATTTCGQQLSPGASCQVTVSFLPGAIGSRQATVTVTDANPSPSTIAFSGVGTEGYYIVTSNGSVETYGDANFVGDTSTIRLNRPIVGMASTGDNSGYWLVATDGGIFNFGDAPFYGSTGAITLNKPIVGMVPTPDDGGYWLVASDGGVFNFGDAGFYGSTGGMTLNKPIVGMTVTPDGRGYWLVASDGGIFNFGDAPYLGSTGAIHLNKPVVGMAAAPDGGGYWLVASDGGIFNFGDAPYLGSTGGITLNKPIVGMAAAPDGRGYWLVASDGGIFNFGAPFYGSSGGSITNAVGMAESGYPTLQATLDLPA